MNILTLYTGTARIVMVKSTRGHRSELTGGRLTEKYPTISLFLKCNFSRDCLKLPTIFRWSYFSDAREDIRCYLLYVFLLHETKLLSQFPKSQKCYQGRNLIRYRPLIRIVKVFRFSQSTILIQNALEINKLHIQEKVSHQIKQQCRQASLIWCK